MVGQFTFHGTVAAVSGLRVYKNAAPAPAADVLMMLAFFSALLTLLFLVELRRSKHCLLGLAISGTMLGVCTLIESAWPAALVLLIWSITNLGKWISPRPMLRQFTRHLRKTTPEWSAESRVHQLFGDPPMTFN
jgi:hypothetical protein